MDPIVEIDSDGNGQVTLYCYGKMQECWGLDD
jgi:hypothetical protein